MKLLSYFVAAICLSILTGCIGGSSALLITKKDNVKSIDLTKNGVVALSILGNNDDSEISIDVVNTDSKKTFQIEFDPYNKIFFFVGPFKTPDIKIDEDENIKFYYYQLPKGNYQITKLYTSKYVLARKMNNDILLKESSFSLNDSEITYIGSFNLKIIRNGLLSIKKVESETKDNYDLMTAEYTNITVGNMNHLKTKKELVEISSK